MPANNPLFIGIDNDFDWNRVVVEKPRENNYDKGGTPITWFTSKVYAKGDNGEKLDICFQLPTQNIFGISGVYPMGMEESERGIDNLDGFQICYPITSYQTINTPTAKEQKIRKIFDLIRNKVLESLVEFADLPDDDENKLPQATVNNYYGAERKKDPISSVKPLYTHAFTTDKTGKKVPDLTKNLRSYIKLGSKGKGKDLECKALLAPNNNGEFVIADPRKFMNLPGQNNHRGDINAVMYWKEIFWGSHGPKSPYGASAKVLIDELDYTPTNMTYTERKRMLPTPPNITPITINEDDDLEDENDYPDNFDSEPVNDDQINVQNLMGNQTEEPEEPEELEEPDEEPEEPDEEPDEEPEEKPKKKITKKKTVAKKSKK